VKVLSKSPRQVRDIFKAVHRLELSAETDRDQILLSDLARILNAGSTVRGNFAAMVGGFRDSIQRREETGAKA